VSSSRRTDLRSREGNQTGAKRVRAQAETHRERTGEAIRAAKIARNTESADE